MVVLVTCRRSESKCFLRSYVFADCGHEDKRKSKRNIVCLCGLQWLCLLSVGDMTVNVSSGRMSLRTALPEWTWCDSGMTYVFADCVAWVVSWRMSLRTASTKSLILLVLKKLTHDLVGSMTWNFVAGETSYKLVKKCLLQSSHVFAGCVDTVKMCCDPHMLKKKGSSKWALLKHVTRTNSIGTCSSELYIFSLLKLPPPPRAAICYIYIYMYIFVIYLFLDINQQILSQPLRICYLSWVLPSDTKKEPMTLTPWMGRIPLRGGCAPGVVRKPGGRQDTKQDDFRYPEPPEI